MPTKKRREKEQKRQYEKDGDYGPIDTGYVFGNPAFTRQSPLCKLAEMLAWLACFKERDDVLKPDWLEAIRLQVGYKKGARWDQIVLKLSSRKCWEILPDGSLKVLRIKEKRPSFPWKEKGHNGHSEGTKTGNIEGITPSTEKGHAEGVPFPVAQKSWMTELFEERRKKAESNA